MPSSAEDEATPGGRREMDAGIAAARDRENP
jgi:hypothetical protein